MPKPKAVIFDWAGTMVDFGSFGPMAAFVDTFKSFGVEVSIAEARAPMGLPKRAHIQAMLAAPAAAAQWRTVHGRAPRREDVDRIYDLFVPKNEAVAADHAALVPGALDAVAYLRGRGARVGSTTGYTRSIMQRILPVAAAQGYSPDNLVCADDLAEGRPGPLMMYQCFIDLAVYPPNEVIKVDDTVPGIKEGVAAGCVTVGVALSGNECALTPDQLQRLGDEERETIRARAASVLFGAGADHVIDTVADLPALLDRLGDAALARSPATSR